MSSVQLLVRLNLKTCEGVKLLSECKEKYHIDLSSDTVMAEVEAAVLSGDSWYIVGLKGYCTDGTGEKMKHMHAYKDDHSSL